MFVKQFGVVVAAVALALSAGCGSEPAGKDADQSAKPAGSSKGAGKGSKSVTPADLPGCAEVKAAIGDFAADMVVGKDDDSGPFDLDDAFGVQCTWVTPETVAGNPRDFDKFGGIALRISVERTPSPRAADEAAGLVRPVPVVEQAGGYVVSLDKNFDLAGPMSALGAPQVIIGGVNVSASGSGLFLAKTANTTRTNAQAIEANLKVHDLIKR